MIAPFFRTFYGAFWNKWNWILFCEQNAQRNNSGNKALRGVEGKIAFYVNFFIIAFNFEYNFIKF